MRAILLTATLFLLVASGPATATDRSYLWRSEEALAHVLPDQFLSAWPERTEYGYDVEHVDLDMTVDFTQQAIDATCTLSLLVTAQALTEIVVDLNNALTVDQVTVDGSPRPFVQQPQQVVITPSAPLPAGTAVALVIDYHGRPLPVGTKSMRWNVHAGTQIVYALSTPYSTASSTLIPISHYWRPCKDVPDDKSTCSMRITVPEAMLACSNGIMVSNVDNGNGTRTVSWEHDYPVAPYLITMGATNYLTIEEVYQGAGGATAQIQHFVYPENYNQALISLNITADAIACYASLFGEYPFMGEKYGMFATPPGPAVEEQTMTAYPAYLMNGAHTYDWVLVHELSHMWWGDCVTCRSWEHVWLNEGFASYSEALWIEHLGGAAALRAYMVNMDNGPYEGTIYDPPYVWHAIVYEKAAWLVHMLRHVMGDSAFFQFLLDYRAAYEYSNVVTDDLIAVAESVYGGDLDWFFEPWLYHEGEPFYASSWTYHGTGPYQVTLNVEQVQSLSYPTYKMPIDLVIQTSGGNFSTVIWDSLRTQWFTFEVAQQPLSVTLDPGDWILADFTTGTAAVEPVQAVNIAQQSLELAASNPFRDQAVLRFALSRPGSVALRIFDVDGRMVRTLQRGACAAGAHDVTWDTRNDEGQRVAAGVYFCRLTGPGGAQERRLVLLP